MQSVMVLVRTEQKDLPIDELLGDSLIRHFRRRQIVPDVHHWDGKIDSIPTDRRVLIITDGPYKPSIDVCEECFWKSHVAIHDEQICKLSDFYSTEIIITPHDFRSGFRGARDGFQRCESNMVDEE